jgi:hypothetical protein
MINVMSQKHRHSWSPLPGTATKTADQTVGGAPQAAPLDLIDLALSAKR